MDRWLAEPARTLCSTLAVGEHTDEADRTDDLAVGIDGMLRQHLGSQNPIPPEWALDGFVLARVERRDAQVLVATGLEQIGFAGERFPVRATVDLMPGHPSFAVEIGGVDPSTGFPARLPADSMILFSAGQPLLHPPRQGASIEWHPAMGWPTR